MNRLFLFVALTGFALRAFGQDYLPGYVIINAGDTLRGFLLNGSARAKTQAAVFRADRQPAVVTYRPSDIRAYVVGTEGYVAGLVDGTPIFFRELVYGRLKLASLKRGGFNRFFLLTASGTTELTAVAYYRTVRAATPGCPPLPLADSAAFVRTYPFQEVQLVRLFADLNACSAMGTPPATGKRLRTNRLSSKTAVYAGFNWARLIVPTPHPSGRIRNRGSFHLGVQQQWGLFEAVSLQTELYFSNSRAVEDIDDANSQQKWTNQHEISLLTLPILLNVTFRPGYRLRPFTQLGYQFSMNLGGISEYREYDGLNGITLDRKRVEGGLSGFVGGVGVEYALGRSVPFLAMRYSSENVNFNEIGGVTPKRSTSYQGWHILLGVKW